MQHNIFFFLYNGKAMTGQAIKQDENSSQSFFWASDTTGECSLQRQRENSGCCFQRMRSAGGKRLETAAAPAA